MTDQARIPLKHPTKPTPPPGGWPTGGTEVAGWHLCTPCGDSIYPGEHVYDNGDGTVRCAVCEIKHRSADRVPAPRPVPTTRQRLTDARRCHTPEQHRHTDGQDNDAASHARAMRELTAERDRFAQAHATAEQTATFRQGVIDLHAAELGAAGEVIAVVRDAQEQIERALARYDTAPEVTPVEQERECNGGTDCCPPTEGELFLRGTMTSREWHAYRAKQAEAEADLGSVSPHAQDGHAQGYAEAIAHLRDDARYMHWWSSTGMQPAGPLRQHLADYLETVGPAGAEPAEQDAQLPAWVLDLVRGLDRYELEHPQLWRQMGAGEYVEWPCPEPLLALVPAEARRQAEVGNRDPHELRQG